MSERPDPTERALLRILADQRQAHGRSLVQERRVVSQCGGRGMFERFTKQDIAAAQRASAAFGLTGGELCGCHEQGCETCASNWGCGVQGCETCIGYGWQEGVRGPGTGPKHKPAIAPPDTRTWFDAHSHFFCTSYHDWEGSRKETDNRAGWLTALKAIYPISRLVISGQFDKSMAPGGIDGPTVDDVVDYVTDLDPDYFIPFVRGIQSSTRVVGTIDILPGAADYVDEKLAAGFVGVGELFVFGHGGSLNKEDFAALAEVGAVAAEHGAPIQVHWEFVNPTSGDSAYNWERLLEFLEAVETAPDNFLATRPALMGHAGIGELTTDQVLVDEWAERLQFLIDTYPYLWFDIAGLQVPERVVYHLLAINQIDLTLYGKALAPLMAKYPERFLVGMDAETRFELKFSGPPLSGSVEDYGQSMDWYRVFLTVAGLNDVDIAMILSENAPVAIYWKPPSIPKHGFDTSIPRWDGRLTTSPPFDPSDMGRLGRYRGRVPWIP